MLSSVALPERPAPATAGILLVDDKEDNLLALEAVLERLGPRLVRASSGAEALAAVEREEFALVVLDVQMPGMDGFQTARLLNARRAAEPTPIIFLTANSHDPASQLRGYAEGAVDYLVKPFDPVVLRSKVSVFVALYQARKQVALQTALLREHVFEAQRRESEARYHALAEAMPQVVWTADHAGRLEYCNGRWFEYTGLDRSELARSETPIHPDDRPAVRAEFERAVAERRPFEVLYRVRRASDGTYRWHLGRAVPSLDAAGQVVRWIGTATEVDAQRRSEEEARFLAEASNALAASFDLGLALQQVTALAVPAIADLCAVHMPEEGQRILHLSAGRELLALLQGEGPDPLEPLGVGEVLSTGLAVAWSTPAITRRAAAQRLGIRHFVSVPLISRGAILGALTFLQRKGEEGPPRVSEVLANDLARRVALAADNARLYSQAQDAVRLRDEFLSVASHELRTPLTPLNLKLGMLRRRAEEAGHGLIPAPRVRADVTTAARHVERLTELVDHLLDVTRIRAGKIQLQIEPVDLAEVVRDGAMRFAMAAADVHSPIELDVPPSCIGRWDQIRLEQVITNLLSNALKFGAGTPVQVKLSREGERVLLVVKDQGIGMDEAMLARVFGRFERGPSSRNYAGLGLGLYITKQIVIALDGTISVQSAPGRGAVFTVDLPLASPEGASLTPSPGW
jgi:PAS domain S-box-containing protein